MRRIVSIDIGSTWTKGAAFRLAEGRLELVESADTPTTQDDLSGGFREVLERLSDGGEEAETYFSSSAKGGLRIAAIGLAPELTLEAAKLAALSAGGLVTGVFAYKLCDTDIESLRRGGADIVLLCGGSDGGNESYVLHNARMLAGAGLEAAILYAGNRAAAKEAAKILEGHEFHIAGNVLPELRKAEPEPARERIRELFLERIARGRGLDSIVRQTGASPLPTPCAMFEFLRGIYESRPGFGAFCAVDVGGATTDVYSCCPVELASSGAIPKGLPEPEAKRSVEGDLGMRASAAATADSMRPFIDRRLQELGLEAEGFSAYVESASSERAMLPSSRKESLYESVLSEACCAGALSRHAGRCETAYLPEGRFLIQRGRNLKPVRKIICAGGGLVRLGGNIVKSAIRRLSADQEAMTPSPHVEAYVDAWHLLPLLANIFQRRPKPAIEFAIQRLEASR